VKLKGSPEARGVVEGASSPGDRVTLRVAELAASGLSNRQVAEQQYLSACIV
jgi:hypothetical protein